MLTREGLSLTEARALTYEQMQVIFLQAEYHESVRQINHQLDILQQLTSWSEEQAKDRSSKFEKLQAQKRQLEREFYGNY